MPKGYKINWTDELLSELGKIPDSEFRKKYGISENACSEARKRFRIKGFSQKLLWTEEMDSILGTMTDADVAKKLGISIEVVSFRRYELNISAYRKNKLKLLLEKGKDYFGFFTDKEISNELNVSQNSVEHIRRKYNIDGSKFHKNINNIEVKKCGKCSKWKALNEFYSNRGTWDGLYSRCKKCVNIDIKTKQKEKYIYWSIDDDCYIKNVFSHRCPYCGCELDKTAELEHFIPISNGGYTIPGNCLYSCWECNRGKGGKNKKLPLDWLIEKYGENNGITVYWFILSKLREHYRLYLQEKEENE